MNKLSATPLNPEESTITALAEEQIKTLQDELREEKRRQVQPYQT